MLRAGRPDRNDHDFVGLELLQQRRRDVVDAAGDDDLVERRRFGPAVIAVGGPGLDRRIFLVAARDQRIVDAARALGERGNDLDRPQPVGQVAEVGRLVAGAGADLEHFVAGLDRQRVVIRATVCGPVMVTPKPMLR